MRKDKSQYYLPAIRELTGEGVKSVSIDENNEIKKIIFVNDNVVEPSHDEIKAKAQEMVEANYYVDDRKKAYPSIIQQLDTIYHKGIDEWKADIKAIKDKYPKE
tara:strand:- start:5915 stop:6226 length:312 start_codon:yes stop_codon:yes gene_type:complete